MKKLKEGDITDHRLYCGKVKRLAVALTNHGCTKQEAEEFISSAKGVLDADKRGIARWFRENLSRLEDRADFKQICEECACCLGGKREAAARQIFKEEPDLKSRVNRLLKTPLIIGCGGEMLDEKTFTVHFFPKQDYYVCSCLRLQPSQMDQSMPDSYCYCCCGHIKHHIQKALGYSVEVELITSALTTSCKEGCTFCVKIGEPLS